MVSAGLDRQHVESLVREVLRERWPAVNGHASTPAAAPPRPGAVSNPLMVNVSARHGHVTQEHLEQLFGPGSQLTKLKDLYQEGEFASEQQVNVFGPRNRMIPNVRILGPVRNYSQVELSYSDAIYLGMDIPLGVSGKHEGTPGCTIVGPRGAVNLDRGLLRAQRHVHMNDDDLAYFGVKDGDLMKLRIDGPCGLTFDKVLVRYHPKVKLEVHIDTDEGNACDLRSATHMELINPR